jgi:ATP/maltotriose-dependent transcriptional regulator MalT
MHDLTVSIIRSKLYPPPIAPDTVKRHAHSIYEKLNVKGRYEAVTKAVRLGLISNQIR